MTMDPKVESALQSIENGLAYIQANQFADLVALLSVNGTVLAQYAHAVNAMKVSYQTLDARAARLRAALGSVEPPSSNLSKIAITAVTGVVNEDLPNGAAVFEVTRKGDAAAIAMPCSVTWLKTGTTQATDFAAGTIFGNQLSWAPGDARSQRIGFPFAPDAINEPDETVVVLLSAAAGCDIATASATVTVKNDDAPPAGAPKITIKAVHATQAEGDKSPVRP